MISPERWARLEPILDRALELPPEEVAGYLDEACGEDARLREEVERLLQARTAEDGLLEEGAAALAAPLLAGRVDEGSEVERRIGRYRVLGELGRGGMGVVCLAHDPRLDRRVAIKVLSPWLALSESTKRRFTEEARAASALDHPHIETVHEIGETEDGRLYIVMAYYEGETLAERIARGPLLVEEAVEVATQLADALAAAHARGIVHRDVKPSNVVLTSEGGAKLVDFGVAKVADHGLTATGGTLGTVAYMSPEQTSGEEVDGRSDLWSLGVVVYEMLTGERPFAAKGEKATIYRIRNDEPAPVRELRPEAGEALAAVVARCLAKEPAARWPDAGALRAALVGKVDPEHRRRTRPAWSRRSLAALAATIIVLAIASAILVGRGLESGAAAPDADPAAEAAASDPENPIPLERRIAVLPFASVGPEPDSLYLAEGLTEEIGQRLARLQGLQVIGPTSVRRIEGASLPDIAAALGVGSMVTGGVRKAGDDDRVRITVRLVDASTQEILWSQEYDGLAQDLFTLPPEVASRVAAALDLERRRSERSGAAVQAPVDREAFLSLLRARYYWNRRSREDIQRAERLVRKALDVDPTYAEAWAMLGQVYVTSASYGLVTPAEGYTRARAAAERALEIRPALPEAHVTLATIAAEYDWDFERAEDEYARAIEMAPSYALARQWNSELLAYLGRTDQAAEQARRAQELDPLNLTAAADEGRAYYLARDFDRAIERFQAVIERGPNFVALLYNALALTLDGRSEDALRAFEAFHEAFPRAFEHALIVLPYAELGRDAEVARTMRDVLGAAESGDVPAFAMATLHGWLGDRDRAFSWLERAYDDRNWQMLFLAMEPVLDPLRADPRFEELLERVGFPPEVRRASRAAAKRPPEAAAR